ncbi:MAG: Holliday junction branch migration DNA helicase RuvB [Candidatus Colwellbacteria bacterium]|nr:Holliday junction branch migration DNA helicase RuvB [Candidatus Colwellbacteria bacterium]
MPKTANLKNQKSTEAVDQTIETLLQPKGWSEYIGQANVKKSLRIILEAAKRRSEPVDHLLFYGQAGLGKTTLAKLVALEMGAHLRVTSGPAIEKAGDLAAILSNLEENEILFIDEAHRLNRMIEEVLYPAMESRKLHIVIGKGPGARTISLDLPAFTLVAATTRVNLLSPPLRSRFGATFKLDYYDQKDIEAIIKRSAEILGVKIESGRTRDYLEVHGGAGITEDVAEKTLAVLEIDSLGLETHDQVFLNTIIEKFHGGPVGIGTIAAALNEDKGIIEDVYEPYLMRLGFLRRTPAGRMVENAALEHLGKKPHERLI